MRFLQNGDPLVLKGSGIDFTKPVSRATFGEFTPAIFVESPTVGEKVKSPFLVWGTANTLEAVILASGADGGRCQCCSRSG